MNLGEHNFVDLFDGGGWWCESIACRVEWVSFDLTNVRKLKSKFVENTHGDHVHLDCAVNSLSVQPEHRCFFRMCLRITSFRWLFPISLPDRMVTDSTASGHGLRTGQRQSDIPSVYGREVPARVSFDRLQVRHTYTSIAIRRNLPADTIWIAYCVGNNATCSHKAIAIISADTCVHSKVHGSAHFLRSWIRRKCVCKPVFILHWCRWCRLCHTRNVLMRYLILVMRSSQTETAHGIGYKIRYSTGVSFRFVFSIYFSTYSNAVVNANISPISIFSVMLFVESLFAEGKSTLPLSVPKIEHCCCAGGHNE